MTNERAVEILNLDLDILGQYGGETAEAYKMAIKALEAQPSEDCISREEAINEANNISLETSYDNEKVEQMLRDLPSVTPRRDLAETSQDCISREAVIKNIKWWFDKIELNPDILIDSIVTLPSVKPKYTDEEIDKAQAVEQAYVDKMVELAVEETRKKWLNSFDTSSATKCFEAVNVLKERLKHETN